MIKTWEDVRCPYDVHDSDCARPTNYESNSLNIDRWWCSHNNLSIVLLLVIVIINGYYLFFQFNVRDGTNINLHIFQHGQVLINIFYAPANV